MESQQENKDDIKAMKTMWLRSLSQERDDHSSLKLTQKKRGFFESLRQRCASWIRTWPMRKKYKGAKSDIERFAEVESFMIGNMIIRSLLKDQNDKDIKSTQSWTNSITYYRKNPEAMCHEIGVMLSKCSGKGVTFGQVRTLLTRLAGTQGVDRNMIDDEIVRRLPTKMQIIFKQEMENLLDADRFHNIVLYNTREHINALSMLQEPVKKPEPARITKSGLIIPEGEGFDRFGRPLPTPAQRVSNAQRQAEESLQKRREFAEQMTRTKDTEVFSEPIEVGRR